MAKIIDLYAGAGGLSLGAARAGFEVASAVEIDSNAIATHKKNFPMTIHINKDILKLSSSDLYNASNIKPDELFGIIGGPPCQGFSSMGQGIVNDPRNKLFLRFFKIVQELKPNFFLAENVPGILRDRYSQVKSSAFSLVSKEYSMLPPLIVKANEFGAPTTRTRVFFIGYLKSYERMNLFNSDFRMIKSDPNNITTVEEALEGLPMHIRYSKKANGIKKINDTYYLHHEQCDFFYSRVTGMIPASLNSQTEYMKAYQKEHLVNGFLPTKHLPRVRHRFSNLGYGEKDQVSGAIRLDPSGFCPTLRAGTGPDRGSFQALRPIHYNFNRVINPREAARLQGFPDWFELPGTIWHSFRQIGNSVSPIVAEQVLKNILYKLT